MFHSKAIRFAALASAIALAVGCGDERVPSKTNLESALNRDYAQSADCLFAKAVRFPYELSVSDKLLFETRHRLDAMVDAGLLSREATATQDGIVNRYSLTARGVKAAGDGRFCYGRREVTSVEKFTQPVDYRGMPLTTVNYRFVLKNQANWSRDARVRDAFHSLAVADSEQPVDEATVVYTQDGWVLTY